MLRYEQIMGKKYISVDEAAIILDLPAVQVLQYCAEPNPSLRVRHAGGRTLIRRKDIERLLNSATVTDQAASSPATPDPPAAVEEVPPVELLAATVVGEVVPIASTTSLSPELLSHIRLLEDKLTAAYHEVGRLRAQLDTQQELSKRLTDDVVDVSRQKTVLEAEQALLQHDKEHLQRIPWWIRIFWR